MIPEPAMECTMPIASRSGLCVLLAAAGFLCGAAATVQAAPLSSRVLVSNVETMPIQIGRRFYRSLEESRYPPNFYVPPPRGWWRLRSARGVYYVPRGAVHGPRIYGWVPQARYDW
jgi:hypothetical protein